MIELKDGNYQFAPHEIPIVFGSPATPDLPIKYRVIYFFIAIILSFAGCLQIGFLTANIQQIGAYFGVDSEQSAWLTTIYYIFYGITSLFLFKLRQNLGIEWLKGLVIISLVTATSFQLFANNYSIELVSRIFSGISANGCMVLSLFYYIQSMPKVKRLGALLLGFSTMQLGTSLSYVLSPLLMHDGQVTHIFLFEFALSLLALAAVILIRLPPTLRYKTFEPLDILSYFVFILFVSGYCIFYLIGNVIWWDKSWLFWPFLVTALSCITLIALEMPRKNPILPKHWIMDREIITFVMTAACLRVILSEQKTGAMGLLTNLGYNNDQLWLIYLIIFCSASAGLILSFFRMSPTDIQRQLISSLLLISVACFMDTRVTVDWAPANFYFSQGLLAFASLYFFGPMAVEGLTRALSQGPLYVVSFAVLFSSSQLIGSLLGADLLTYFTKWRTQVHYTDLSLHLTRADPRINDYINSYSHSLNTTITDPVIRGANAVSQLASDAYLQANVLAYQELFTLAGYLAAAAFIFVLGRHIYHRLTGTSVLGPELKRLAERRKQREEEIMQLEQKRREAEMMQLEQKQP